MILLWGVPGDTPMARIREALSRHGCPVVFVDQQAALETEIEPDGDAEIAGTLRVGAHRIDMRRVSAAYLRTYGLDQIPALYGVDRRGGPWARASATFDALVAWTEMTPALVVNRFSAMASNSSKPYQARLIEAHGFSTPETLISTDPDAVHEFWLRHGAVVYKSISGVRSIVSRLTREHASRLEQVRWCPTQFQQYIPGNDYRIHVIGDEVFASEIRSSADDYRYARRSGATVEVRPSSIPATIADRCRSLARRLGLAVAGVDLRCRPTGEWYCFEVNPSPAFTFYQAATDQPMDEAIARLLIGGHAGISPVRSS